MPAEHGLESTEATREEKIHTLLGFIGATTERCRQVMGGITLRDQYDQFREEVGLGEPLSYFTDKHFNNFGQSITFSIVTINQKLIELGGVPIKFTDDETRITYVGLLTSCQKYVPELDTWIISFQQGAGMPFRPAGLSPELLIDSIYDGMNLNE
jgi:hypothetical protein